MANEPHYRDQSKLDYLPAFNDRIVVRIDRVALAAAVAVGLFGILYFSLAPAAMSTDVTIGTVQQDGYLCIMIGVRIHNTKCLDLFGSSHSWSLVY
jgi:hypothetical protein